jgi:hypothetical protein
MKFKILLSLTFSFSLYASDIHYQSKINIAEFDAKSVKYSWCIFSEGDSNTSTGTISNQASGKENSHIETFSHRGNTYLARKVQWKNQESKNGMTLNFKAESSSFGSRKTYDNKTCTYKTWMGQSTSAETTIVAKAAFVIPKNVWAIRIISETQRLNGVTTLTLSNDDYHKLENDELLIKKAFFQFEGTTQGKFFLVNPSYDEKDNFVYLDLNYVSKSMLANEFNLSFRVEFIAAEQCLSDLKGLDFIQVLEQRIKGNDFENALINMACMLNTNYVKHNLGTMHLNGLPKLFEKLRNTEKLITQKINSQSSAHDIETLQVLLKLIDRVSFYYGYEILKETMSMFHHQIDYQGKRTDGFLYFELLRRKGVIYLYEIFENLIRSVKTLKQQDRVIIEIPQNESLKFEVFLNNILPLEFKSFARAHELIFRPQFLASASFDNLDSIVNNVNLNSDTLLKTSRNILLSQEVTFNQLERFEYELRLMSNDLRFYTQVIESMKLGDHNGSTNDYIAARINLLNQMEQLYQVKIIALISSVEKYFFKHFEDPEFKNIRIGGKQYLEVKDFIEDFSFLMDEVK